MVQEPRPGRPPHFEKALSSEEWKARKRDLYAKKQKDAQTSAARRRAAFSRWQKDSSSATVDSVTNPDPAVTTIDVTFELAASTVTEVATSNGEIDDRDLEIGNDAPVEETVEETSASVGDSVAEEIGQGDASRLLGSSQSSQSRARNYLKSIFDDRDPLERIDLIRQFCLDLPKRGIKTYGVEVVVRKPISKLSWKTVRAVSKRLMEKVDSTTSFRHWLPSLLEEHLEQLESEIGGPG